KSSTNRKTSVTTGPGAAPSAPAPTSSGPVTAELEGGVKITSDAATNSLVVTANSADYQTLKRVIKKLDIPRLQVFVETAILEVALDDKLNIGTNIAAGDPARPLNGGFIGDQDSLVNFIKGVPTAGATIPIFAGATYSPSINTGTATSSVTTSAFMGLLNLV